MFNDMKFNFPITGKAALRKDPAIPSWSFKDPKYRSIDVADADEKIAEIDGHIGAAMSGLVADARTLVDHARVEAQNHTFTYDEPVGVEALTQGECYHCRMLE